MRKKRNVASVKLSTEPRLRPKDIPDPIVARPGFLYPLEAAIDQGSVRGYVLRTHGSTLDQSQMALDARFRNNSGGRY